MSQATLFMALFSIAYIPSSVYEPHVSWAFALMKIWCSSASWKYCKTKVSNAGIREAWHGGYSRILTWHPKDLLFIEDFALTQFYRSFSPGKLLFKPSHHIRYATLLHSLQLY
jgi:hypothetical protein